VDADHLAHVVQGQPARDGELEPERALDRLPGQHLLGDLCAHANAPGIGGLLQPAGFLQADHHARIELLPHARHGSEHGGRDLAHVLGDGFRVLDEVQLGAGVEREVLAADALGDVAQRQEAHALVAVVLRDQRVVAAHGIDQALVAVHRALGLAGGARGVDQDRQVVRRHGLDALHQFVGVAHEVLAAQHAQLL
jgi:hypothetical protein